MGPAIDIIAFYTSCRPDSPIEAAIETCERAGFVVRVDRDDIQAVTENQSYKFRIYHEENSFNSELNLDDNSPSYAPFFSVSCGNLINPAKVDDNKTFHDRMHAVFELMCRLSVTFDVDYAPLFCPEDRRAALDDRPIADNIEELPRIGVYDEAIVDQLGGIDAMFDRPPWYTATLDRDKVVIVETEQPWDQADWQPPTDADFLDTAAFADPDERAQGTTHGFADPFASLETGAIGTELCVPKEKLGPEFRNEDLELVRVRVDEDRNLRRLDDRSFVRNVVDDDPVDPAAFMMAMLEDIPADAAADDLMVSTVLKAAIPPAFVRLDDPDGETVVTKVAGLDVDVPKVDLLISLGRVAHDRGVTDETVREIKQFLNQLDTIDDVAGIEQRVRDRLL